MKLDAAGFSLLAVDRSFRQRLGSLLLTHRIQVLDWNELEAAKKAGIEPKTVRRIERGLNFQWDSLEKYAVALGQPLEEWLRLLLQEETHRAPAPPAATDGPSFPASDPTATPQPDRRQADLGPPPGLDERRSAAPVRRHEA